MERCVMNTCCCHLLCIVLFHLEVNVTSLLLNSNNFYQIVLLFLNIIVILHLQHLLYLCKKKEKPWSISCKINKLVFVIYSTRYCFKVVVWVPAGDVIECWCRGQCSYRARFVWSFTCYVDFIVHFTWIINKNMPLRPDSNVTLLFYWT